MTMLHSVENMTTKIPLTQGQHALIDDEDVPLIKRWKWRAQWKPNIKSFYAVRSKNSADVKGAPETIRMHRVIMNYPENLQVDHINHNTLDNCKRNLRIVTNKENQQNRIRANKNSISGRLNISWLETTQKWRVKIGVNGREVDFGCFTSLREAVHVAAFARKRLRFLSNKSEKC